MDVLPHHKSFNCLYAAHRKVAMAVALICLTALATSCRSTKTINTETTTEYIHDTMEVVKYVYDTARIVNVKIDSVDRFVERTVYVDSNGVAHEKEVERLTKFIFLQDERYASTISFYENKLKQMKKSLKEAQSTKIVEVERKLTWFQKMMMWFGAGFVIVVAGFCIGGYVWITDKRGKK